MKWDVPLSTTITFDDRSSFPIAIPKLVFHDAARQKTAEPGEALELDLAPTGKATVEASFGGKTAIIEIREGEEGEDAERACD